MPPHHQRRLRAIGAALRPPPPSVCGWGEGPQMGCCAAEGYNETGGSGDNWPPILVPPGEEEHHAFDS